MSIGKSMIAEFDQEMKTTRRVLERVPSDQAQWRPHPKSFPLAHLAQLVSWMPGWITNTLTTDSLDLSQAAGYSYETTETLLHAFDENVRSARAALEQADDSVWQKLWSLKHGERVLFAAPVGEIVRNHISHLVHHRAQLGMYLRLLDLPVPSMYGPTADEQTFATPL